MSASLVGSEMCIRDSPGPVRQVVDTMGLSQTEEAALMASVRSKGLLAWMGTVSYTHLTLPTICSV
eukprot:3562290-Alexandrium_andersonii.AAC.1